MTVVYKMVANEIENKVADMLKCLDIDIEHIRKNLLRLNEMRGLIIKRDDNAKRSYLTAFKRSRMIIRKMK